MITSNTRAPNRLTGFAQLSMLVVDALKSAVAAYLLWRQRKTAVAELHALGDRDLADIGLKRSEIDSVIWSSGRDPTRIAR
jgi:uncharacterized protein YjiS (DUF1127 family)